MKRENDMEKLYKERIRFTQISNDIIQSTELTCKAKAVYCYLFSRPDGWVFYRSEIEKNFKEGKNTISGAIKELEDFGVLSKQQSRDGGMYKGCEYYLSAGISTVTQKTVHGKTDDGKTVDHESDTNNTNISNTDLINTDSNTPCSPPMGDEIDGDKFGVNETLFDKFWDAFKDKRGKEGAERVWNRKRLYLKYDEIMLGAENYVKNRGGDRKFWKQAQGWLNDGRWEDEAAPKKDNDRYGGFL